MIKTYCIERLQRALRILERHAESGKTYQYRQVCKQQAKLLKEKINAIEQGKQEPQLITYQ